MGGRGSVKYVCIYKYNYTINYTIHSKSKTSLTHTLSTHCLAVTWPVPCETAAILVHSVHTIQSQIHRVHAFLACNRPPAHTTAVTLGWNGYLYKSQHRKLTVEKKILPPLQPRFEPATFQSQAQCSNH